jgi:hypothetical protein
MRMASSVAADGGRGRSLGNRSFMPREWDGFFFKIVIPLYSSVVFEHDLSGQPGAFFQIML